MLALCVLESVALKVCNSILAREFWLQGELQTPCCCIFFGFSDGSWLKALYNDEQYLWEISNSDETPDKLDIGDSEFSYPYKEYLPESMSNCGALISEQALSNNKLVVSFSKLKIALSYDVTQDIENIEINT